MFQECRIYLSERLKQAGIRKEPVTTLKKLELAGDSHVGAILFEKEELTKNGSKKLYLEDGDKKKRRKVYNRDIVFTVVIGEYTQEAVEKIYEGFLVLLDKGIYVDKNYVEIVPEETDWVDADDSIINAKCAVQVKVRFKGGIYKDTGFAKVSDVALTVETQGGMENEYEQK